MAHSHHDEGHGHGHGHHGFAHVMPVPLLLTVFFVLLGLTWVTTWVSANVPLGSYELIVSMGIASVKAGLVMAFFMHMMHEKPFNIAIVFFSLVFVALFVGFTLHDKFEYKDQETEAVYDQIRLEQAK
ncbi:cytochrome C oxidase subunit IV family protein [Lacunimicrobium album]